MPRALAAVIFAYAGLSVAQVCHVTRWLYAAPRFWCGNVISDPLLFLINTGTPLAGACSACLAWRCIRARRWPAVSVTALFAFLAMSAVLASESFLLERHYGLDILCGVWWLPGG